MWSWGMKTRLVVLLLLSMSFTAIAILPETTSATTLYVGGAGPGNHTTIQGAIDAASPGDTVFVSSGTYLENVIINRTITLKGEDRDTTMVEDNGTADVFQVSADFVNISGFTIGRTGPFWEGSAIKLNSSQGCHIANNNVSDNGHGISLLLSNNNKIVKNIALNTSFGIYIAHSENNEVAQNNISDTHVFGIAMAGSEGNLIRENNVSDNHNVGIFAIGSSMNRIESNMIFRNIIDGIFITNSSHNRLENNTVSSNGRMGVTIQDSWNTTLSNNLMVENGVFIRGYSKDHWNTHTIGISNTVNGKPIRYWRNVDGGTIPSETGQVILGNCSRVIVENQELGNASVAIMLGYSNNNSITSNIVADNYFGLYLEQSVGNAISDNDLIDNWDQAVWLYSSDDNTLLDNNISDNGHGLHLEYSDGCEIADNDILSNLIGIHLRVSNSSIIANNRISDNYAGLHLERSNLNKVLRNRVTGNHYYGIDMDFSNSNTVSDNTISSNTQGINLFSSNDNLIYHNNLINNSMQAYDKNGTNWWDNGYPAGGNYWSDYEGPDGLSGPGQDSTGGDGIGDIPYEIEGGTNRDWFPLMRPFSEEISILEQAWFWASIVMIALLIVMVLILRWRRRKKGLLQQSPPV